MIRGSAFSMSEPSSLTKVTNNCTSQKSGCFRNLYLFGKSSKQNGKSTGCSYLSKLNLCLKLFLFPTSVSFNIFLGMIQFSFAYFARMRNFEQKIGPQVPKKLIPLHVLCLTEVLRACTYPFTVTKLIYCASHIGWFYNHIIDDTWETYIYIYIYIYIKENN